MQEMSDWVRQMVRVVQNSVSNWQDKKAAAEGKHELFAVPKHLQLLEYRYYQVLLVLFHVHILVHYP